MSLTTSWTGTGSSFAIGGLPLNVTILYVSVSGICSNTYFARRVRVVSPATLVV